MLSQRGEIGGNTVSSCGEGIPISIDSRMGMSLGISPPGSSQDSIVLVAWGVVARGGVPGEHGTPRLKEPAS